MTAGKPGASGDHLGLTVWVAPNPFGETTAYLLLHPRDVATAQRLPVLAAGLGLLPADQVSDMPRIGTDHLSLLLTERRFELRSQRGVLVEHVVSEDWLAAARERRYIVLAVGRDPIDGEELRDQVAEYLARRDRLLAGIVNLV